MIRIDSNMLRVDVDLNYVYIHICEYVFMQETLHSNHLCMYLPIMVHAQDRVFGGKMLIRGPILLNLKIRLYNNIALRYFYSNTTSATQIYKYLSSLSLYL